LVRAKVLTVDDERVEALIDLEIKLTALAVVKQPAPRRLRPWGF
jgi:hypothetical protein